MIAYLVTLIIYYCLPRIVFGMHFASLCNTSTLLFIHLFLYEFVIFAASAEFLLVEASPERALKKKI